MRTICIVADTHRRHRELVIPPCDLVVHCGDMCSFQEDDAGTLADIDGWFGEIPAGQVVCIGGNHDHLLERGGFRFSNATYLCDAGLEIDGLEIYGSPWCPDLPGFAFHLPAEELAAKWSKIPGNVDLLVTHTPPLGILDVPSSGGIHLGCPALAARLEGVRPRLHAFGHVHASYGELLRNGTRSINAAVVAGRDFHLARGPVILTM